MTVNVECPACEGTGSDAWDGDVCIVCMGQRHVAVDRLPDGRVPPGYREWILDLNRTPNADQ